MNDALGRLMARAESDETLRNALASASTPEEFTRVAADAGFDVTIAELTLGGELDERQLDDVAGGTILYPTMSVFCGTNGSFCTFNPYACQAPA